MNWWIPALLAAALYGVWGFLSKFSANQLGAESALFFQAIGGIFIACFFAPIFQKSPSIVAVGPSILVGILGMAATLFFLYALTLGGPVSIVNLIISLSPAVTILLAFVFFNERVSLLQGMGMLLGLISIILLCQD